MADASLALPIVIFASAFFGVICGLIIGAWVVHGQRDREHHHRNNGSH